MGERENFSVECQLINTEGGVERDCNETEWKKGRGGIQKQKINSTVALQAINHVKPCLITSDLILL